jgi:hypothetical protein
MEQKGEEILQVPVPEKRTSGLAIASMVLSICGLLTAGCTAWVGLILGIVALAKMSKRPELQGSGFAIAGIVVGGVVGFLCLPAVAAIAIPSLLRSQVSANETAAVGTLRTLVASQAQFRGAAVVDQDNDGTGEYGYFQELAGYTPPRTVGDRMPADVRPGEYITQVLGSVASNGVAAKSGYHFYMYLPDGDGGTLGESVPLPEGHPGCANDQETRFVCYAWPVNYNSSGRRCFVVNQQGEVFQAKNVDASDRAVYDGYDDIPEPGAAFLKGHQGSKDISAPFPDADMGETGNDGQVWEPAWM